MSDLISRQAAIDAIVHCTNCGTEEELRGYVVKHYLDNGWTGGVLDALDAVEGLPSTQPDRLTDDDFETIRIHLNSYKEKLCNQKRWKEAEEYQRIIDRFMAFASAQPEQELLKDGTLVVKTDFDMTKFDRVNVIQNGTHYGDLFYQDDDTRRKGKWIRWYETLKDASGVEYMPRCKCSECGKEYEAHSTRFIDFCPNCGCRMEEGDSDE